MNHLHEHHISGGDRSAPAEPGYPEHPELKAAHDAPASQGMPGGGHDKYAEHSVAMFRKQFWVSLGLTIPTLVWGYMLHSALGYIAPQVAPAHEQIPPARRVLL